MKYEYLLNEVVSKELEITSDVIFKKMPTDLRHLLIISNALIITICYRSYNCHMQKKQQHYSHFKNNNRKKYVSKLQFAYY